MMRAPGGNTHVWAPFTYNLQNYMFVDFVDQILYFVLQSKTSYSFRYNNILI